MTADNRIVGTRVVGVGTDIIEIERIKAALRRRPRLLLRVFTDEERARFAARGGSCSVVAGCFAAKEAAVKAAGGGSIRSAEVSWDASGRPSLIMRGRDDLHFFVSISHSRSYATAVAVAVERADPARR